MKSLLIILFCIVIVKIYSWGQGDFLVDLDETIVQRMQNLTNESASTIIDYMQDYYGTFLDLNKKIENKNKTKSYSNPARILLNSGRPKHVDIPATNNELINKYNWDCKDIKELNSLLKQTRDLWKRFKKNCENLQDEPDERTTSSNNA